MVLSSVTLNSIHPKNMALNLLTLAVLSAAGILVAAYVVATGLVPVSSIQEEVDTGAVPMMVMTGSDYEPKVPESVDDFYPVIQERWGQNPQVTDEMEASRTTGFDVRFPRMEPDYNLQLGVFDPLPDGGAYVWLFYSKNPIPDDMTLNRFWADGGITINYHKQRVVVVNEDGSINTSSSELPMSDIYGININNYNAIAISQQYREFQGFDIHDPAQVDFIVGNTYISLQAYMETEELIDVAKIIPFDSE